MEQSRSGPMAGRTVLVTGGTGGIGRATALGLAAMGAHLAITGRDHGRTEDAAREIRAAGGQVDVFVADLSSQAEVRRLAGRGAPAPFPDRCAGQQRRGLLEHPARHRRRARAHLRPEPSRAVPAHQPAPRSAQAERPGPRSHGLLQRRRPSGGSTSTTSRANGPTPAHGPTTSPSSPTSCSPTSWPGRLQGTAVTANALHPGVVRTSFGAEDPGGRPAAARPVHAALHEVPGARAPPRPSTWLPRPISSR